MNVKKTISGIIASIMTMSWIMPTTTNDEVLTSLQLNSIVNAEDTEKSGSCGENVTWKLSDDGVLIISGEGEMEGGGFSSDSPFYNRSDIKSVIIEDGVTSIGVKMFVACENLVSISMPNSISSIYYNAFASCTSLKSISIPDSVDFIGDGVFYNCKSLENVKLSNSIKYIDWYTFSNCESLKEIVIPDSVTSIGGGAFESCKSLANIRIPDTVTYIGADAFSNTLWYDTKLKESPFIIVNSMLIDGKNCKGNIEIPDSVKVIGNGAFSYCETIENVVIGDSVLSIEDYAFEYCSSLKKVTIGNSMKSIEGHAFFRCESLKEVIMGNSVLFIGQQAFAYCESLENINISTSMKRIEVNAFEKTALLEKQVGVKYVDTWVIDSDKDVTSVELVPGTTGIADEAFEKCENLSSVIIPDTVTCIGREAFYFCKSLENIVLPESVLNICSSAFSGTPWLSSLGNNLIIVNNIIIDVGWDYSSTTFIPNSVKAIADSAFYDKERLDNIVIPESVLKIGSGAFSSCDNLKSVVILSSECDIYDSDWTICNDSEGFTGVIYGYENSTAQAYAEKYGYKFAIIGSQVIVNEPKSGTCGKNVTWKLSDDGVLTISGNGKMEEYFFDFEERFDITSVVIEEGVTSIETFGFQDCINLKTISIPGSIESISDSSFKNCINLSNINVSEKNNNYCSIDGVLFSKDKSELIAYPIGNKREEYIVPDDVKKIGYYAFLNCQNLKYIEFPNSITSIYEHSFANSSLIDTYEGVQYVGTWIIGCDKDLTSFSAKDGTQGICGSVFKDCTSLKTVDLPNCLKVIPNDAFTNCSSLESITIPDSVESVGSNAFYGTPLIENQTGVKYADKWVIGCDKDIVVAEIKEGTKGIALGAFNYCKNLETVIIPASVEFAISKNNIGNWMYDYLFYGCSNLKKIEVAENNKFLKSVNGILFNNELTELIKYPSNNDATEYTVPDSVKIIHSLAFSKCNYIQEITIPDSVLSIGGGVFSDCKNLNKVNLPNSIETFYSVEPEKGRIGLFYNCTSLKEIIIPNGLSIIGAYEFCGCSKLTNIVVPENIKEIEWFSFADCSNLNSITINNPECIIDPQAILSEESAFKGAIYGYEKSTAQTYAKENGYKFESLGEKELNVSDIVKLKKYLLNINNEISERFDFNSDGHINVFDMVILRRIILEKIK